MSADTLSHPHRPHEGQLQSSHAALCSDESTGHRLRQVHILGCFILVCETGCKWVQDGLVVQRVQSHKTASSCIAMVSKTFLAPGLCSASRTAQLWKTCCWVIPQLKPHAVHIVCLTLHKSLHAWSNKLRTAAVRLEKRFHPGSTP